MNIKERINKYIMFEDFYYDFLLEELKIYINNKLERNYSNVKEIFNNKDEFPVGDRILVETFMEVGENSYYDIFSKINLEEKDKVMEVINKCKQFFENVRDIDDESVQKYQQYYSLFELVNTYLYKKLEKEELLIDDIENEENEKILDIIIDNLYIPENEKLSLKEQEEPNKWNFNVPDKYDICADNPAA